MAKLVFILLVLVLVAYVSARHLHPREDTEDLWRRIKNESEKSQTLDREIIEVELLRNMRPSRFMPINNELYIASHSPCQPGYKRDGLGVCREVWD